MAGGEDAKRSGDFGEKIVKKLIELIGWKSEISNIGIECIHDEKHKLPNTEKRVKHGVDFLFQYRCPLRSNIQQNVIISSKHRDGYPATPRGKKTKFKEFLIDIVHTMECFPTSEYYRNKTTGTSKKEITGVLFWIDSSQEQKGNGVVEEIYDLRLPEELNFRSVLLIDNKRADFIHDSITYAYNKYEENKVEFFYIDTGYNNSNYARSYSGKILPVEYLNADVLPFKIKDKSKGDELLLISKDNFNYECLKRLIGLAQDLTKDWSTKIEISFPDFNFYHHEKEVYKAKNQFSDNDFIRKVEVTSYKPNFRSIEG